MTHITPAQPIAPAQRIQTDRQRFRLPRTVFALMLREMATTYGRSVGGYLWAILDPVLALTLLSVVFSMAFSKPSLGSVFPLFYATGYLPFMLYMDISGKIASSIRFSRPLLAYPCVTFVDALIARFVLNFLAQLTVFTIVMGGIVLIYHPGQHFDIPVIASSLGLAAFLGLGIGTLNCYLTTRFPVWERAWQILNRPLFLISGVFFLYGSMPKIAQDVLWYNPLLQVVGMMRKGVYRSYDDSYVSAGYVASIAIITLFMGLLLLVRHHRDLLDM